MDSATATKTNASHGSIEAYLPATGISLGVALPYVRRNPMRYKRAFDIVVASALVIGLLSWMFPIIYLLIKISSRGPVFFIQKRAGLRGKIFDCIKFRTMYVNKYADEIGAVPNDKRITPIGRWLRRTCLDELPQVFNVLKGDMSIVGPRPHMMAHHHEFSDLLPAYMYRHTVKPGITGLSQIKGFHGSIMTYYCIYGRTRLDLFYIRKANFWLDVLILFRTIGVVIAPGKTDKC